MTPRGQRPDPTTLDTDGAIAVLTERVGNLADAVETLTGEIKGVPGRVCALEDHDKEQDAAIEDAKKLASVAAKKVSDIEKSISDISGTISLAAKTITLMAAIGTIIIALHALGVI